VAAAVEVANNDYDREMAGAAQKLPPKKKPQS
jgi:hypothetical protein